VATVAVGKAGPKNAAILACQILSVACDSMAEKLQGFKQKMAEGAKAKNEKMNRELNSK